MDEEIKRGEQTEERQSEGLEPFGFKVSEEEAEIALKKLLAGWEW